MLTKDEITTIDRMLHDEVDALYAKIATAHNAFLPLFQKVEDPWFVSLRDNVSAKVIALNGYKSISEGDFTALGFYYANGRAYFKPLKWEGLKMSCSPFKAMDDFMEMRKRIDAFNKAYMRVFGDEATDTIGSFADFKAEVENYHNHVLELNRGLGDGVRKAFHLTRENA